MNNIKKTILALSAFFLQNRKSKIIFYHDVFDKNKYTDMGTPLDMFQKHIQEINAERFNIVPEITEPNNQIQICFDDGFRGIWDVRDVFINNQIYPTVFLAVSLIGKDGYLNKEEILELQQLGFRFQSHAWSHLNLTDFNGKELDRELKGSKDYLSDLLQREVNEICFPIGFFSEKVKDGCLKAGYVKMYSSIPGNYYDNIGSGLLPRNLVQFYDPTELKNVLYGGLSFFKKRYIKRHYIHSDL